MITDGAEGESLRPFFINSLEEMKKKRIIYGVRGMMEYQALLHIGKASLRVSFTDGSATAMGSVPATFATANPVVQMAIEGSREYQRGLITKIKEIDLGGDVEAAAPAQVSAVEPLPVVEEKAPASAMEQVEVSDLDTAKQYLMDRFGLAAGTLRYKKNIEDAAAKRGIKFVGL